MKKILFAGFFMLFCMTIQAQSSFETRIKENIVRLNAAKTIQEFDAVAMEFSSLKRENSKNRWQAYYYTAQTYYKKAELQIKNNDSTSLESNAMGLKYINVIAEMQNSNADIKKLIKLLTDQKKKIGGQ